MDSYVNALFDRYARLLVLRVDFLYRIATLSEMEIRQARNKLLELSSMDQMRFFGDQEGEEELTRRETLASTCSQTCAVSLPCSNTWLGSFGVSNGRA